MEVKALNVERWVFFFVCGRGYWGLSIQSKACTSSIKLFMFDIILWFCYEHGHSSTDENRLWAKITWFTISISKCIQHSTMLNERSVGRSRNMKDEGFSTSDDGNMFYFITEAFINTVLSQCATLCAKHSICSILYLKHAQFQWLIQMVKYNNLTRKSFHIYRYVILIRTHVS